MNTTEQALRNALADWASGVTAPPGLADAVHARDRRGLRRRRAVISVFTVLAVLAGAGVAWAVAPWRADTTAVDRLVPAAPPRASDTAPPSPVDFGWLPDGFTDVTASLVAPGGWRLAAKNATVPVEIELTVSATAIPPIEGTGTTGTVTVNGTTATTYSVPPHPPGAAPYGTTPPDADGATEAVTFRRASGQWIRVYAHFAGGSQPLGVTAEQLRRVAEGLVDRERRVPDVVDVADTDGLVMAFSHSSEHGGATVGFLRTSGPPSERQWITDDSGRPTLTPVMVYLGSARSVEMYAGFSPRDPVLETVRVKDRVVVRQRSYQALWNSAVVKYANGQVAVVLVPKSMSDEELMTFATGITPGADYRPPPR